jgi:CRP-like cAMP-binding protein
MPKLRRQSAILIGSEHFAATLIYILLVLGKGQHFGETALINNASHRVTVRARTRVRVAMLGKRRFLQMLRFVDPMQDDFMRTIDQQASEQAARRAKLAAHSEKDQGEWKKNQSERAA